MIESSDIHFGNFDGFSWIRCGGKGDFAASSEMKKCAEHLLTTGCSCLVIDLEACTGMDSTFMGTLTGLALRLVKQKGGGRMEIASANEKNTTSLEDLGLDAFMEINPTTASWQRILPEVRMQLRAWDSMTRLSARQRGEQVLEAHKNLTAANDSNAQKFGLVLEILENELKKSDQETDS